MQNSPTFSVVIAAYNAAATIDEAIASVLAQTRTELELIVVDDGSSDDTAQRVRAHADDARVRLLHQPNGGPSAARNAGITAARGDLLSMLDSDDLLLPGYLDDMERALAAAPEAGFAYCDAWVLEEATGKIRIATAMSRADPPQRSLPLDEFLPALMSRNFIFNAVTVRRSVLEHVGGYAVDLRRAEDYELWLRIATAGYGAIRLEQPRAIARDRLGSLSKDEPSMLRGVREAYRRVTESQAAPANVRELAATQMQIVDFELARLARRGAVTVWRRRARAPVASAYRRATARRRLRAHPPAEIAAAFPELGRGRPPRGSRRP